MSLTELSVKKSLHLLSCPRKIRIWFKWGSQKQQIKTIHTDTHTRGFEEGEGPSLYIGEVGQSKL